MVKPPNKTPRASQVLDYFLPIRKAQKRVFYSKFPQSPLQQISIVRTVIYND
jgi:hypothetical protein